VKSSAVLSAQRCEAAAQIVISDDDTRDNYKHKDYKSKQAQKTQKCNSEEMKKKETRHIINQHTLLR
jgi:hypothetical protein